MTIDKGSTNYPSISSREMLDNQLPLHNSDNVFISLKVSDNSTGVFGMIFDNFDLILQTFVGSRCTAILL